jgi:Glycosyl hydrolases family 16
MLYLNRLILLTVLSFAFIGGSCKKSSDGATAPTNLQVTAVASTDGSGTVAFTSTAANAVTYTYEFGNGDIAAVPTGIATYKYTIVGNLTYTVTVTATSSSGGTVKKSITVTVNVLPAVQSLIWAEEFNVDGAPDPAKWGYDLGAGGWGNGELQYYTARPENATVLGGVLKIKAIKESFSGSAYTSARLLTKDKFSFKYGKVEVRAKLPAGGGTWPAVWMLGSNINTASWPACGEIDIMEHLGNDLNKIYGTLHYPGRSGGNADGSNKIISNCHYRISSLRA